MQKSPTEQTTPGGAVQQDGRLPQGARRALTAAVIGTLIEWYDYALYGAAAGLVIGPLFFSDAVPAAATMAAFATFAVGFVARPLGGIVIGHIGDKHGRKPAMMLTILLMGAATVGIGLLPTAAAIGAAAPLLLVVFRLLQGLGAGAELAGAMTLVAEFAPPGKRGKYTSFVLATPPAGIALATLAFFLASAAGDEVLLGWAWRIPFLVSAVLFFVALYIRSSLEETPEYVQALGQRAGREQKVPLGELWRDNRRQVFLGFLSITGHNAVNYVMAVFAVTFMASEQVGMARSEALLVVTIASLFCIVGSPLAGRAADRYGAGRVLAFGAVIGALFAWPLFLMMATGNPLIAGLGLAIGYAFSVSASSGAQGAFLTNLFPPKQRFSGVALARETNGALIAGLSPLIAAALIEAADGGTWLAAAYLAACCLCSILAVALTRGRGDNAAAH
ncbi:ABC transporter permease [Arthrobacter crystallopoietes BAB-32]|uniref:ABC transporter permease n=1 Tax=Arthrobacter crystallopoietes BAB-32 TaxID=1246476 RepID=N1V0M3_9MICC|nr:MFS transporter [Arthrobacter crystallopoietes]EMY34845.1 ABC transporter permease [Arthrobacter crystallopoietes BAB-32]